MNANSLPSDKIDPPQAQSDSWPAWIAWGVILLVSGFLMIAAAKPELRGREPSASVADLQVTIAAKIVMGTKGFTSLLESSSTKPSAASMLGLQGEQALAQIDSLATTPSQKIKAAIVSAEVRGADEAVRRINDIESQSPANELHDDLTSLRNLYTAGPAALNANERKRLLDDEGYLGKLALSFGAADSDSLRQQVIAEGRRTLIVNFAVLIIGAISMCAGLALFILAIVLLLSGTIKRFYVREPLASSVYLEIFAVWLLSYVVISLVISKLAGSKPSLAWTWLVGISLPLAFGWGLLRGLRWNDMRQALGWHAGKGWHIEIPMGLVGYLTGLPIIAVGAGITIFLVSLSGAKPSHPIMGEPTDSAIAVFALYSIASIFAPIVEETVFRGALFHHMRRRWNWPISAAIVATIFAAIHPQGLALVPALASIAIVLAGIREWRGSLLGCITAHAFHNGVLITLLVLSK